MIRIVVTCRECTTVLRDEECADAAAAHNQNFCPTCGTWTWSDIDFPEEVR